MQGGTVTCHPASSGSRGYRRRDEPREAAHPRRILPRGRFPAHRPPMVRLLGTELLRADRAVHAGRDYEQFRPGRHFGPRPRQRLRRARGAGLGARIAARGPTAFAVQCIANHTEGLTNGRLKHEAYIVRPVICLVTDRRRFAREPEEELVRQVRAAAAAGVHLVQVRERDLATRDLLNLVGRCVEAARGTATRVLVNDRVDVALAAGAHGVHLPANGVPPARLRRLVPSGFLVGRSGHDAEEGARGAADGGGDYPIFGTVFSASSKPGAAAGGLHSLRATVGPGP